MKLIIKYYFYIMNGEKYESWYYWFWAFRKALAMVINQQNDVRGYH
jgi:hypothetical protein